MVHTDDWGMGKASRYESANPPSICLVCIGTRGTQVDVELERNICVTNRLPRWHSCGVFYLEMPENVNVSGVGTSFFESPLVEKMNSLAMNGFCVCFGFRFVWIGFSTDLIMVGVSVFRQKLLAFAITTSPTSRRLQSINWISGFADRIDCWVHISPPWTFCFLHWFRNGWIITARSRNSGMTSSTFIVVRKNWSR